MPDVCAVCGRAECDYPARQSHGRQYFEFEGAVAPLSKEQMALLHADHAYDQRHGQLGTRPIAEVPSVIPPKRDWLVNIGMWMLVALLLAMAWYGIGCGTTTGNALERTETALKLLQCIEQALPPADSGAAEPKPGSSSPAAATTNPAPSSSSLVDAGAADSGIRSIGKLDPWWEPDGGLQ